MTTVTIVGAEHFALLLGLSLFFGFAFEEFYWGELPHHPGGVRTFPLLAITGAALFWLEPHYCVAFVAGLLVLGSWIFPYVQRVTHSKGNPEEGTFIVPTANLLAYVLGPVALTQPLWASIGIAVAAVLLLGGKRTLHDWAHRVSDEEVITLGKFLILVGIVLPLLAGRPPIPHTSITPFGVWLAVIAVSTISYASYLLARYVFPRGGTLLGAILGGLYSSTATTVVLARRARDEGMTPELEAGIMAASAMMYLRIIIISSIFNAGLGAKLFAPLLVLAAVTLIFTIVRGRAAARTPSGGPMPNPLQLTTAFVFAALFIIIALLTSFVQSHLGSAGILGLAAVVGVTDVDPFVLSLAQGGAASVGLTTAAFAIVIATSSNNVLKAVYTMAFSRRRESWLPAAALVFVSVLGIGAAFAFFR
ncbi:MAG: DUF4010 domain-containing protein [Candidatus Eremiobacteraeota bacterium]|nr:DUF4010 domain-containing protein [Candidatus Eremiobacteraeota bacterium]